MASTLRTVGYEGAALNAFRITLRSSCVSLLIDVHAVAVSRSMGLPKTALAAGDADSRIPA